MPAPSRPDGDRRRRRYTYNPKLVRQALSYTIQEIADLFALHPNAVRRWVQADLPLIDNQKPYMVHGSDLIDFLRHRQQSRKRGCGPGEMYCCRCRAPRRPIPHRVTVERVNARQIMVRGSCELCQARMNRASSFDRLEEVKRVFTERRQQYA